MSPAVVNATWMSRAESGEVMSYAQFPYAQLVQLGTDLDRLSQELEGDHHGAQDVHGLDEKDHAQIRAAVEGFQDEWKSSLLELIDNIGKTGKLSQAIGTLVQNFDAEMGKGLAGKSR